MSTPTDYLPAGDPDDDAGPVVTSDPGALAPFVEFLGTLPPGARKTTARGIIPTLTDRGAVELQEWRDALRDAAKLPGQQFDAILAEAKREQAHAARQVEQAQQGPTVDRAPAYRVNITRVGDWRYSMSGPFGRAVYEAGDGDPDAGEDATWRKRAPLPYVHARIVRRDGSGRRVDTDYLMSGELDGPRVIVTDDEVTAGQWAKKIGLQLSSDKTIITAAGTAVRETAYRDAPEVEAVARPDGVDALGRLVMPPAECMPDGYLRRPAGADDAALRAASVTLIAAVAKHPKLALAMGASGAAPFVRSLRRQSFWLDLYGDPRRGKSTTMAVVACVWGDPSYGTGCVLPWNSSAIGTGRHLGQLGIMPPFFDERGQQFTREQWGEVIYSTTQGSTRLTAEAKGTGTRRSSPWFGVFFSSGNGRLTDGLGAGRFAGIPARVVELGTPFTATAAEAETIARIREDGSDGLVFHCYGYLGPAILAQFTPQAARGMIATAAAAIGQPDGGTPRTIAEHLHLAVAGAAMLDAVAGTGTALHDAALTAALDYLAEHTHTPDHDADRMLAELAELTAFNPAAWPTETEYVELRRARPDMGDALRPDLAQGGYDHDAAGMWSSDGVWLYVRTATWVAVCERLGADSSVALRELHGRGALHVAESVRLRGKWTAQPRIGGKKSAGVYQIRATALDGDGGQGAAPDPVAVADPVAPVAVAQLDDAAGLVCSGCGGPLDPILADTGAHPACMPDRPSSPVAAPQAQTGPAVPAARQSPENRSQRATGGTRAQSRADARRDAQAQRFIADVARLADGKSVRVQDALETTHAPQKGGRAPYWRPPLPPVMHEAHIVSGYSWSRPFAGPTVVLDRSGAFIAAASSVDVAHGALAHTGTEAYCGRPGLYLVDVHPWLEGDTLPSPLGDTKRAQVWVAQPTVARLVELADAGRWPDVTVLDSYTGDPVRLRDWAEHVRDLREHAITTYTRDGGQYEEVKTSFGQAMALMRGEADGALARRWKTKAARPDIPQAIMAQSGATMHRWANAARDVAGAELGPVAIRNVDELVIPAAALEIVTTVTAPGRRSPIGIDPTGIKLGTFKVKASEGER